LAYSIENEDFVNYLIEHGADVNKETVKDVTPLSIACYKRNETIIKYLVELGADINKENVLGDISLSKACISGNKIFSWRGRSRYK